MAHPWPPKGAGNTGAFRSLCPDLAYAIQRIDDRDVEKMGLEPVDEGKVEYQCTRCGIKFGATYPRFVERCPSCRVGVP